VPVQDKAPDRVGQITVIIFAAKADQGTAEKLASALRGFKLLGDYRISPPRPELTPGTLFYSSEGQVDLAKTKAERAGDWLSKVHGRKVQIEGEFDPRVRKRALFLTMPDIR
jgi:hypothetical protein